MSAEPSATPLPSPKRPGLPSEDSESTLLVHQQTAPKWQTADLACPDIRDDARIGSGSLYLQPFFLVALVALFLAFVAALEALKYVSDQRQGFVPSDEGKHYLWTYGPTLVLSLVAAVWGQVEYRVLQSTPWMELRKQPLPAERSLLLNYLSPWSITSLFKSLVAGHFPVALVLVGGLILKVLIVVSTGLFALESTQTSFDTQFSVLEQFNFSKRNSEAPVSPAYPRLAFWAFYKGGNNARFPPGTTLNYSVLSTAPVFSDVEENIKFTAPTFVFGAEVDCVTFSWTLNSTLSTRLQSPNATISLANVTMSKEEQDLLSEYCLVDISSRVSFQTTKVEPRLYSSRRVFNKTIEVDTQCKNITGKLGRDSLRVFTSVLAHSSNSSALSAALCHPRYSVTKRQVTIGPGNNVLGISNEILDESDLGETQPSDLTYSVMQDAEGLTAPGYDTSGNRWVRIMSLTTPVADWRDFSNATLLASGFRNTFKGMAAITVRTVKTRSAESAQVVPGQVTVTAPRLQVTAAALRVVESLLAFMAVVGLVLCLLHRGARRFESAPSLMDTAVILSRSRQLSQTLVTDMAEKTPTTKQLASRLRSGSVYLTHVPATMVQVQGQGQASHSRDNSSDKAEWGQTVGDATKWWLPWPATPTYALALTAVTLLSIATLEALYQVSERNGGLLEVPTTDYNQYLWRLLPTFIMACIGLAYVAMDRSTQTLHPFLELAKGRGSKDTLEFEPRSNLAFLALIQALRRQFFGLSAVIVTSILGSILAIAASGLYSTVPYREVRDVSMEAASWFDTTLSKQRVLSDLDTGLPEESVTAQAIAFNNMSYPAGTYGPFAFALPSSADLEPFYDTQTSFAGTIPAARAQANCSLHAFHEAYDDEDPEGPTIEVPPPAGCLNGLNGTINPNGRIFLHNPGLNRTGYTGFIPPANWNFATPRLEPPSRERDFKSFGFFPELCNDTAQHFFVVYGHRTGTVTSNMTVLHCAPYIEGLEVQATVHLPNFTIDNVASKPKAVSLPTPWTHTTKSNNSVPRFVYSGDATFDNNFGDFFLGIIMGHNGIPIEELAGPDKVDKMLDAVNGIYQEQSAQSLRVNYRAETKGEIEGQPSPGRIQGTAKVGLPEGRGRLVQSALSTRLLEGLLVALVVFSGVGWTLVGSRRRVLPVDPGSVAARMALLAGSELVERVGGQGRAGLQGEKLRLGWWDGREGRRFGIDMLPD